MSWSNSGDPGYGPYLRVMLPPEVTFDGAQLFGSPVTVVSNVQFPDLSPNPSVLVDPLYLPAGAPGAQVIGTAGWRLVILELPVGSVVANGPQLETSICVTTNNGQPNLPLANVGEAYPIQVVPIYRYGDTATGANGSISGAQQSSSVTPQVLLFQKTNTAPEGERPPGSVWTFDYVLSVDIAVGAVVNPLVIADTLPGNVQFVGPITVAGGEDCSITSTPSTSTPGGSVEVSCTGSTMGAAGAGDVVVSFPAYITDVLAESTCGMQTLTNTATVNASYLPPSAPAIVLPQATDESQVVAMHVAVQKSAAQQQGVPGTDVAYTLNLQTTQFGTTTALSVLDNLPDGMNFATGSAQISINGAPAVAIVPLHSGAGHPETLVFDVIAAYGGPIPPGTAIQITYTGTVLQLYETETLPTPPGETPPYHAPILAADPLTNVAQATYSLAEGANGCSDDSSATVTINPVEIHKELLTAGPFIPGQYVTFRLSMAIPSGDSQGVVFTDFLPLPVFDVMDIDLTYGGPDIFRAVSPPVANADTLNLTPIITRDPAANSLTLSYPNINTPQPQIVAVDIRARVQPHAFADNLFLTNIFRARSQNSGNVEATGETPVQIQVRAPALGFTKGVLQHNGGTSTINPAPGILPVNGDLTDADGGDSVVYRLTIENRGGAPAYDVIATDTVPTGLTGCSVTSTQLADGTPLTSTGNLFAGGLTLIRGGNPSNAVLDANDGTLGAPFGTDTAFIDVTCTVAATVLPGSTIVNAGSVTWKPQPPGPGVETFPPVEDTASVSIRNVSLNKSIVATSEAASTTPSVMIGEIVRYRLQIAVPEGEIPSAIVRDALPAGLQYLGDARIALVSNGGLTATNVAGGAYTAIPAAPMTLDGVPIAAVQGGTPETNFNCAGSTFGSGTDPCFVLGNVTNTDNDGDVEYIVIEFNALVLNTGNAGTNRDNTFRLGSNGVQLGPNSNSVRVTLRLPTITVGKTVSPNSGVDAGDVVTYTLSIANATGANVVPGYDVAISDTLPSELQLLAPGSITGTATPNTPLCNTSTFANTSAGNTVSGTIGVIPPGCTMTIAYQATVLVDAAPGTQILNSVTAGWSSVPGTLGTTPNDTGGTNTACVLPNDGVPNGNLTCERIFTGSASAPIGVEPVALAKAVVDSSLGYTSNEELAIGETATFRITATIPEGTAPQVVISDVVPSTATGRMEVLSGAVISTGSGMTIATPAPVPVIVDAQLGDGLADTISFNFGQVTNPVGNNTPAPQTIVVEVVARLIDHPDNTNGDVLTNNASVQFGPGLNGTAQADVEVVEPLLDIQKSSPTTTGQAGDVVNFSVTVQHQSGSAMQAREVRVLDTLPSPAGLTLDVLSVTASVTGVGCAATTLSNASAGNTVDVTADHLPLDCVLTVNYSATLQNDVVVNTSIVNTANLTWHSITPSDPAGPDGRSYSDSDDHTVLVSSPGMSKWVDSVSPDIGSDQVDGTLPDLSIGAVVTWQFDVTFPAGNSIDAVVTDQLPTGTVSMLVESSTIVSVGSAISGAGISVGQSGVATDGGDADGHADLVTWNLGNVVAAPTGDRTVRFQVVARVMDTPQTSGGVTVSNTASFTASTIPTPITATSDVDIVEPLLGITKAVTHLNGNPIDPAHIVQAGDVLTFQITLSHAAGSNATAFNVDVTDVLPNPGVDYIVEAVGGTCGALADDSNHPTMVFSFDDLTLAEASCTIVYRGTVTDDVNPGVTYENLASAAWDSQETPGPGNRRSTTDTVRDDFTILAPTLVKQVASTSNPDTGSNQHNPVISDLAIGESVTYTLTIGFPQGTTLNAVLVDRLPAGLEAIGATVGSFGNSGISTTLPGTPVYSDSGVGYNDTVTFDFGDILNPANGVTSDDWLQVTVTARVKDVVANVDGASLTNIATFTNDTSDDVEDGAEVEMVEPTLGLTKSMTAGNGASATITLTVDNAGTGPAYDVVLEDVFSSTVWNVASISIVSTPAGFTGQVLANTPAAGQTTVRFTSNAGVALPPGGSAVATITATLAVFPPDPNPVQNVAEIPSHGSIPSDPGNPDIREYDPVDADTTLGFPVPVVTKTVANTGSGSGGAFVPGDVVIFNVNVQNIGQAALVDAALTDVVPANTTFVAGNSDAGWNCSGVAAGSDCSLGTFDVAMGATATFAFAVRIDDPLAAGVTQVSNQAILTAPGLPPDTEVPSDDPGTPGEPDDPTDVPVLATPDLVLTKIDDVPDGAFAAPGDTIVYTLSYRNVGNQNATGVTITETVPVNTTFNAAASAPSVWSGCVSGSPAGTVCTLSIGNVAAGAAAATATFAVDIVDPIPAGTSSVGNVAVVADDGANGPDPTPQDNSDDETTPLEGTPGPHLAKSDGDATTVPGDTVIYTLRYWNDGNENIEDAQIVETVPAHTVFAPGSSSAGWTCVPNNNAGSICTLDVGTMVGQTLPANAATALFAVQVNNPLPTGVEQIANSAVLSTPDLPDVPASDETPVVAAPDMAIVKTPNVASVEPGDVLAYTLSYSNVGNQDATGVVITETVPANTTFNAGASTAGWSCADGAPAGTACTFTVAGVVAAGAAAVDVLFAVNIPDPIPAGVESVLNAVHVADDGTNGPDPDPTNNDDDANTSIDAMPALEVTKTDNDATVEPGDTITYVISYRNTGDQNATGVVLTETVPQHTTYIGAGWTCSPNPNAGSTCTYAVPGTVVAGAPASTVDFLVQVDDPIAAGVERIDNVVDIRSDGSGGEPTTPVDQDEEDTPVTAVPDMAIIKSSVSQAAAGGVVIYDLAYANLGNQGATGVVVTETVPANSSFEAAFSSPGWTCSPDGNAGSTCLLDVGTVPGGQSLPPGNVVQFAVRIDDPLPAGVDEIANQARIDDDGTNGDDPDPDNNEDDDVRDIDAVPDLVIVKTVETDRTFMPGDEVVFLLTYSNVGNQDANGVVITETVPVGTSFVQAGSTAGWSCPDGSAAGTVCTLAVGTVAADGASHVVRFVVRIGLGGGGSVFNTVHIGDDGANGPDPTPEDNDSDTSVNVGSPVVVPAGSPWSLLLLILALTTLAWRRQR